MNWTVAWLFRSQRPCVLKFWVPLAESFSADVPRCGIEKVFRMRMFYLDSSSHLPDKEIWREKFEEELQMLLEWLGGGSAMGNAAQDKRSWTGRVWVGLSSQWVQPKEISNDFWANLRVSARLHRASLLLMPSLSASLKIYPSLPSWQVFGCVPKHLLWFVRTSFRAWLIWSIFASWGNLQKQVLHGKKNSIARTRVEEKGLLRWVSFEQRCHEGTPPPQFCRLSFELCRGLKFPDRVLSLQDRWSFLCHISNGIYEVRHSVFFSENKTKRGLVREKLWPHNSKLRRKMHLSKTAPNLDSHMTSAREKPIVTFLFAWHLVCDEIQNTSRVFIFVLQGGSLLRDLTFCFLWLIRYWRDIIMLTLHRIHDPSSPVGSPYSPSHPQSSFIPQYPMK